MPVTEEIFFWSPFTFTNISCFYYWLVITSSRSFASRISNLPRRSVICALFGTLIFMCKEATWPELFSSSLKYLSFIQRKSFIFLYISDFSFIALSFFFLIYSMELMFYYAVVFRFINSSSAHAWLATILDSSSVISLFYFCIILTWYNNLVFSYWVVSASDCTSDAHFLCYFNEFSIACFWLRTVFPWSHV